MARYREAGAQLLITADVDSFAEEAFLAWNDGQDVRTNMMSAFKHFVQSTGLTTELSALEETDYMNRFIGDCTQRLAGLQAADVNSVWLKALKEALDDEMPEVTDESVKHLNSQGLGWRAKKHDDVAISRLDFKKLLGVSVPKDIDHDLEPIGEIVSRSSVPVSFDSRSKWTRCADMFVRPTNQRGCGSCWAFAGASNLEHRMCIATNGSSKVALSRQYITTCVRQDLNYGCGGGWPKHVFKHFWEAGFPSEGCSPYLNTDKYGCPAQCKSGYPRSLQRDLYMDSTTKGIKQYNFARHGESGHAAAQLAIYRDGPVTAAIPASPYMEWLSYDSGLFEGDCNAGVDHAGVVIGWSTERGGIYYTLLNSWGGNWGEDGTMRLAKCNMQYFIVPGPLDVPAQGWPRAIS